MSPFLDDVAAVQDDDVVCILHGTEPVRDYDDGLVFEQTVQVLHDGLLVVRVEGIGGLVKEQIRAVLVCCPSDEYALLLADTEAMAVGSDLRVVSERQFFYPLADIGNFRRLPDPLHVRNLITEGYVLRDAVREDVALLHNAAALPAPGALAVVLQVNPSECDGSPSRLLHL